MYYEKRKNNSYGIALVLLFLIIIIVILMSLAQRIDNTLMLEEKNLEATGTDTVLTGEFNLHDLAKNASYSIVRSIEVK